MQVSATHLSQWSDQRISQEILPVLVRRLISATVETTALTMPGGDSVNAPGWDGVVCVNKGNAWVPNGLSYWELGTSRDPARKAQSDFDKRLSDLSTESAKQSTFVFVTSRRWPGKGAWKDRRRSQNRWDDVLVWDADDLEAWLETSASTSLWLGTQLGIAGHGIDSVENYWSDWQKQSKFPLTATALFSGREQAGNDLKLEIEQGKPLISVMADSQSEAVAFICAQLIECEYSQRAACVTSEEGWQFVDANSGIDLVVVTDNQLSGRRAPRDGISLIVPLASGDQSYNLMGIGARATNQKIIELKRPKPAEFEKSLLELGVAPSDASRYTRTMGRSWSVFRRLHALNPSVRKPAWVDAASTTSLQVLTLVGAWNGESEGDRTCIAQVANKPYEDIENELLDLAALDDAPVIKIGSLWKAKAPLELLYLMAPMLTNTILSRFFLVARAVFEEPDPVLELEDDERWMASIYGKVREQSGVVLDAMADSMAKLGYFSECNSDAGNIGRGVRVFVQQLLEDADGDRWLSISSYLSSFSEAAPDEFLAAIQSSLQSNEKSVIRLIDETQSSDTFSRCWHADLLWALEIVAWYPVRLHKVAIILAELSDVEVKGNWANTPFNSLVSLFRPWYPQTAGTVEARLQVVTEVVKKYPYTGWRLLLALVPHHRAVVSPNAKPKWRDDDAGAGVGITQGEYSEFVFSISNILLYESRGNAKRASELIPIIDILGAEFRDSVTKLLAAATKCSDKDRALVRDAVRKFLIMEKSFNDEEQKRGWNPTDVLRPIYEDLAPDDLVLRHAWIFSSPWVELLDGPGGNHEETNQARMELRSVTVREIFSSQGWQGIENLAILCKTPSLVGWELVDEPFERNELISSIYEWYQRLEKPTYDLLVRGVLHALPEKGFIKFLHLLLNQFDQNYVSPVTIAELMINAPQNMPLWEFVEEQPKEVSNHFWSAIGAPYIQSGIDDLTFFIEKLLVVDRPRTAMLAMGDRVMEIPSELSVQILRRIADGQETDVPLPDAWNISRVFEALSKSGHLCQSNMASLEFAYFHILHRDKYGIPNLMAEIWSSPEYFMEIICLAYHPQNSEPEPVEENMQEVVQTAGSLLRYGRGSPGMMPNGTIDQKSFFSWVEKVRDLAKEKDRSTNTDLIIGAWLADWPCKKNLESWPDPVIAQLLGQEGNEDIIRGFQNGVFNSRGISSRSPFDGGEQEREIANIFRGFASQWSVSNPNLAAAIESLAEKYEYEAQRHDLDGLWKQES